MRYSAIFILILFLTLSCTALPGLQLSGAGGRNILENLAAEAAANAEGNATNQSSDNSTIANSTEEDEPGDLWSWGKIPVGHMINSSGVLVETPNQNDPLVVVPPHGDI